MKTLGRARLPLWLLLAAVAVWGGISTWRRMTRATQVLATTVCPLWGPARITISPDVATEDSQPVRIHEAVHAAQCVELGALRYAFRNLSPIGKLRLEAPAYCAAAASRLRAGMDSGSVRSRLRDDMVEALANVADSMAVLAALRTNCPAIAFARHAVER